MTARVASADIMCVGPKSVREKFTGSIRYNSSFYHNQVYIIPLCTQGIMLVVYGMKINFTLVGFENLQLDEQIGIYDCILIEIGKSDSACLFIC